MAKSLQEQLMGAGLVDKKKAKSIKQQKRKSNKQLGRDGVAAEKLEQQARIEQERLAKAERDRTLNEERQAALKEKEIQAQIKQLILSNLIKADGELGYQFVDGTKIHKIYVDQVTQGALSNGRLAIVRLDDNYKVVPSGVAEKISERDDSFVVSVNERSASEVDEDDPYKDYQIPDDLMW